MSLHSDAWHDANKARCEAVIAFCDAPTPINRDAMERACSHPQAPLFKPHREPMVRAPKFNRSEA